MTKRILLAEDNLMSQKLALLGLKSYHVDVAKDGEEAVELFRNNIYDIILMDIQMPKMTGVEATREIRQIEVLENRIPKTVILALTADVFSSVTEECTEAGMNGFFPKPFRPSEMEELLEEMYSRYTPTTTPD
jgi:CheY-like chemotaxis protein